MKTLKVKVFDKLGIHARPASIVIKSASKFDSELTLYTEDDRKANMKSIMQVLSLAIQCDAIVKIVAEGSDEEEAISAVKEALLKNDLVAPDGIIE